MTVRFGPSLLGIGHSAGVQHGVDGLVGTARVADMLTLTATPGGALAFKGPCQADGLAAVLRNGDVMVLHEGGDSRVSALSVALQKATVSVSVEGRGSASLPTHGGGLGARRSRARCIRRRIQLVVPERRQGAETVDAVGDDLVLDGCKSRTGRIVSQG